MSEDPPIPLPARVSKYELLEFLGGGMSHVFRATDTVLGRTVAIKILTPAGVADPDTKARFLHEARTASSIAHENILGVYDFGEADGKPFMVMEFLRGRTLRAAIKEGLLTELNAKLKVAAQIARALGFVHQHQIVHRDVKPENINLDDSGRAKLMDFGIAKIADLSLTQPGYVLGTPYYMAPEQIQGKPVTAAVDIYAFGILLYELLLGQRPYGGDSIEAIFYKVMHEPLDLGPLATAGVPPGVVAVVARCTKKDADARYPDFNAVAADLENAIGTQIAPKVSVAKGAGSGEKSKLPLFAGIGALAVILAAGGYYFATSSGKTATSRKEQPVTTLAPKIDTPSGAMRLVDAGEFLTGPDKQKAQLPAFYVDETEVSNARYAAFCAATKHPLPKGFQAAATDLPVVNVSIADARAYCSWAGKRLPTALEWEKAARGKFGRKFPWGDDANARNANVADNPDMRKRELHPVGDFIPSASPYGVLNMAGNVWEMVDSPVTPSAGALRQFANLSPPATAKEPWITIRGGSYNMPLAAAVSDDFQSIPERYTFEELGFRCARDAR